MEALIIIIVIILFGVGIYLKSPGVKGEHGESRVSSSLYYNLASDEYKVINDVTISTFYGTTQIDHIVVSKYGIFVIETKNMQGWILGGANNEQWTQSIKGGHKYQFRNPLLQNNGHVKALQDVLKLQRDAFISIVVFSDNAEIKIKTDRILINERDLIFRINSFKEIKFTDEQVEELVRKINDNRLNIDKKTHVQNVNKAKVSKTNISRCPYCGGHLVKRTGKYGPFYGCSNYPKCRFTRKLN